MSASTLLARCATRCLIETIVLPVATFDGSAAASPNANIPGRVVAKLSSTRMKPRSSSMSTGSPTFTPQSGANVGLPVDMLDDRRSEEHTSELQSRQSLVCRLLSEIVHNDQDGKSTR